MQANDQSAAPSFSFEARSILTEATLLDRIARGVQAATGTPGNTTLNLLRDELVLVEMNLVDALQRTGVTTVNIHLGQGSNIQPLAVINDGLYDDFTVAQRQTIATTSSPVRGFSGFPRIGCPASFTQVRLMDRRIRPKSDLADQASHPRFNRNCMNASYQSLKRRQVLKGGLASAIAWSTAPLFLSSRVLGRAGQIGPNSRINIGIIGNGLISDGHRGFCLTQQATQVVALCDVNQQILAKAMDEAKAKGSTCEGYADSRELCARPDVDAVFVTTPDHWHAAISIDAMRNGKDVYVEKPMTLTIEEGKAMCRAAERYGRIVQVGSQQRSNSSFRRAAELVLNGYIGNVHTVVCRLGEFPAATQFAEEPVPAHLDYDRWLGPTPWEPYNRERVKGNYGGGWRRFWEYGSRKNGDWGAHHFDIVQWALGMDESGPELFVPKGYDGEFQFHTYAKGPKVIRDGDSKGAMIRFIGESGEIHVGRDDKFETTPTSLKNLVLKPSDRRLYVSNDHRSDWIDAIKSRQQPICHVGIGYRTATICQLSGIAERLGRPVRWDPAAEQIVGDPVASLMMDNPRRAGYSLPI